MESSFCCVQPIQAVGVGLRAAHFSIIEQTKPRVPWFEVLIDNYLGKGGSARQHLETIRCDYPITFHGVGMSLGSSDPINWQYLRSLKQAIDDYQPAHISDHLCWSSVHGHYLHDLLPIPYTDAAVHHLTERIGQIQDYLGQRILIENVSSYLQYRASTMTEWAFLSRIAQHADCYILLDINNIYVSAINHDLDPIAYLNAIPPSRIKEIHLAGYEDQGSHLLDSHAAAVHEPVWRLYRTALSSWGSIPTLIEWDNNIPDWPILQAEADKAQIIYDEFSDASATAAYPTTISR